MPAWLSTQADGSRRPTSISGLFQPLHRALARRLLSLARRLGNNRYEPWRLALPLTRDEGDMRRNPHALTAV